MQKVTAVVHAAVRLGARFIQYSAEFEKDGTLGDTSLQRFIHVLEGNVRLGQTNLAPGEYGYVPAGQSLRVVAVEPSRALIIEKPYEALAGVTSPEIFSGSIDRATSQPLMGDTSVQVRPLMPDSPQFDFAVNSMTFEPGASLPMVESHVMEHGLLMLAGGGIYRLGDCWHPVAAGDFIWMAPYCPQWFVAMGKSPASYIYYKDVNRDPM
jgi:(S)-ureidoglycine aminohydrolase